MEKQGAYTHYTPEGVRTYTKDHYAYVLHQNNEKTP
jgi:hypothetical protein